MGILGKVFGGKKKETQKKGIVCPYCGANQDSEHWCFSDKKNIKKFVVHA